MDLKELSTYHFNNHFKIKKRTLTEESESRRVDTDGFCFPIQRKRDASIISLKEVDSFLDDYEENIITKHDFSSFSTNSSLNDSSQKSDNVSNSQQTKTGNEISRYVIDRGIFSPKREKEANIPSTQSFLLNICEDASSTSGDSKDSVDFNYRDKELNHRMDFEKVNKKKHKKKHSEREETPSESYVDKVSKKKEKNKKEKLDTSSLDIHDIVGCQETNVQPDLSPTQFYINNFTLNGTSSPLESPKCANSSSDWRSIKNKSIDYPEINISSSSDYHEFLEPPRKKHKKKTKNEEFSENVDSSEESKKKKKKHKKKNKADSITSESCPSEVTNLESSTCDSDESSKKKRKKRKKDLLENSEGNCDSDESRKKRRKKKLDDINGMPKTEQNLSEKSCNIENGNMSYCHEKKKKKNREASLETFQSTNEGVLNEVMDNGAGTEISELDTEKKKRHKKHKDKKKNRENEIVDAGLETEESYTKKKHKDKKNDFVSDSDSLSDEEIDIEVSPLAAKHLALVKNLVKEREKIFKKSVTTTAQKSSIKSPKRRKSMLTQQVWGEGCSRKKTVDPEEVKDVDYRKYVKRLLEKVQNSNESDEGLDNLRSLNVVLPWSVPPLHMIETRVCTRPTPEQRQEMAALGIQVKSGIFTKVEDDTIKENFRQFCESHNLPEDPTPFLSLKNHRSATATFKSSVERTNFVRFLAHGLEDRALHSVYQRFQRLFSTNQRAGRFTPHEDNIILEYMRQTKSRRPYLDLSKILKRDKLAVMKRFAKLSSEVEEITVKWDEDKSKALVKELVKVTGCNDVKELKHRTITSAEWTQLSEKFGIPNSKLRRAWLCTIYHKIFTKSGVYYDDVKEKLVDTLLDLGYDDWRSINWKQVAKKFDGFTGERLIKLFKEFVGYCVPDALSDDLGATLKYLKEVVMQNYQFKKVAVKKININT